MLFRSLALGGVTAAVAYPVSGVFLDQLPLGYSTYSRFAEIGTPAFYLSYARPALFAGTMLTSDAAGKNHDYMNLGGQVDLNFTVALRLPMIFSIGAAGGFEDGHYQKTELLASLKIM